VLLTQFIYRLSFGLALCTALAPPRQVTSGYYRNNLYVLLGLNVLASLLAWTLSDQLPWQRWLPIGAAVASYLGSVFWLYEKPRPGIIALLLIAALSISAAMVQGSMMSPGQAAPLAASELPPVAASMSAVLSRLDPIGGGLILGGVMAAMLLGHWYLNAPGMPLSALNRLVVVFAIAIALRALLCGLGLSCQIAWGDALGFRQWLFIVWRWLSGLILAGALTYMAWRTLKVPNTQSATGILYAAVIVVFLGELTAQLLSGATHFPV
jgi:hypothetical protein